VTVTTPQFLSVLDNSDNYAFPQYCSGKVKSIPVTQYIHRSASIFIRRIEDKHGKVILVAVENYRHASSENRFHDTAKKVLKEIFAMVGTLPSSEPDQDTINSSNYFYKHKIQYKTQDMLFVERMSVHLKMMQFVVKRSRY
jgi:hypothetical protein